MLFYLNKKDKSSLEPAEVADLRAIGWSEKDLENLFASHVDALVDGEVLFVVSQEKQGQEEADILALDEKGTLYIVELKSRQGTADDFNQLLRYSTRYSTREYEELEDRFRSYINTVSGRRREKQPSLAEAHAAYFERSAGPLDRDAFGKSHVLLLIANDLDSTGRAAFGHWLTMHVPFRFFSYKVFKTSRGEAFLEMDPLTDRPDEPTLSGTDRPGEPTPSGKRIFLVNTNVAYRPDAWRQMLHGNKAAAYFDRKHTVEPIRKGDVVCLYHSGVGIIALGRATSGCRKERLGRGASAEYYVPCEFEVKVDPLREPGKALPASVINRKYGKNYCFRLTVSTLPMDYYQFIRSELLKRQSEPRK